MYCFYVHDNIYGQETKHNQNYIMKYIVNVLLFSGRYFDKYRRDWFGIQE